MIDISGIDKDLVLMSLWESGKVVFPGAPPLTLEEAVETTLEDPDLEFDIVHGRQISVTLKEDSFDETAYDAAAGAGAAKKAVDAARAFMDAMERSTELVQQKVCEALDRWNEKYGVTPMQGAVFLSLVMLHGPAKLKRMLAVATSFVAAYARTRGIVKDGEYLPEHKSWPDEQMKMMGVFPEAVNLAIEIIPLTKHTGGALVMRGPSPY